MNHFDRRSFFSGPATLACLSVIPAFSEASSRKNEELYNVKSFGAKGDGRTDDTRAIHECFEQTGAIFFPPGDYVYMGQGLNLKNSVQIIGAGAALTSIIIPKDVDFLIVNNAIQGIFISNIRFSGGNRIYAGNFSGVAVHGFKIVSGVEFVGYSSIAIDVNSQDEPYWKISECLFMGADSVNTIGVSMGKNPDNCLIQNNAFLKNRIHLKFRQSGVTCRVFCNDFIQFDKSDFGDRVAIWFQMHDSYINGGNGLVVFSNKFGNENQMDTDSFVVYSPYVSRINFKERLPFEYKSTGFAIGHRYIANKISGGNSNLCFLKMYSGDIRDFDLNSNIFDGARLKYCIFFINPIVGKDFGPFRYHGSIGNSGINERATEFSNMDLGVDESKVNDVEVLPSKIKENGSGFLDHTEKFIFYMNSCASRSAVVDDADSRKTVDVFHMSSDSLGRFDFGFDCSRASPLWVEFDIRSADGVKRDLVLKFSSPELRWQRFIIARQNWQRIRCKIPSYLVGDRSRFMIAPNGYISGVLLSNPRIYNSHFYLN